MTKSEFVKSVLEKLPKDVKLSQKALNELLDISFEALAEAVVEGERFSYPGFGTFTVKQRAARKGVNPQDPKKMIDIPASKTVSFKPAPKLKEKLN